MVGGTTPEVLDLDGGFDVAALRRATERMAAAADRGYTALVPTQLTRLLDDPAGIRALRSFDGVLVGGAATSAADRERAKARGCADGDDVRHERDGRAAASTTGCRCRSARSTSTTTTTWSSAGRPWPSGIWVSRG